MKAVERINPKFMSCAAACRGFPKLENILEGVCRRYENFARGWWWRLRNCCDLRVLSAVD